MFVRTAEWRCDNGRTVHFGLGKYALREITDTLGSSAQVVKAPGRDGATTYHVTLGQPVINITGSMHAPPGTLDGRLAELDKMEDELKYAFMPNQFGLLIDRRANGARQIRCRAIEKPVFGRRIQASQSVDIELIADSPLWESAEPVNLMLGQELGRLRFPLRLPSIFGRYDKYGVVDNPSPEHIYPIIEIYTASEMVAVINQTTGAKMQIDRPIAPNCKMIIDPWDARASIWERTENGDWVYSEDASVWLAKDSTWWALAPGKNIIALSNEVVTGSVVATVTFRIPM